MENLTIMKKRNVILVGLVLAALGATEEVEILVCFVVGCLL